MDRNRIVKTFLALLISCLTLSAATTYPMLSTTSNRTVDGGLTNLAVLNSNLVWSGTNTFTASKFFPANGMATRTLWSSPSNIFITNVNVLARAPTNSGDYALLTPVVEVTLPSLISSNSVLRLGCHFTKTNALASAANLWVYIGSNTNAIYQSSGFTGAAVGSSGFYNPAATLLFNIKSMTNQITVPQNGWPGGAGDPRNLYPSNYADTGSSFKVYVGLYTGTGATNINFNTIWFEELVLP